MLTVKPEIAVEASGALRPPLPKTLFT